MNTKSIAVIVALFGISAIGADDCDGCEPSQETADQKVVDDQQKIYATTQPIPTFKWSQDRDNLIQIYKQKNESRATHAVVRAAGTGEILWHCPSIGFPIPYDTQLTNPLQIVWRSSTSNGVIEQAEPNGLFTSKNTDATYVLCVDPSGVVSPQYTEQKVEVFTRPIDVKDGHVVFIDGAPTMTLEKKAQ